MNSHTKWTSHCWVISYEGDLSGVLQGPLPEVLVALKKKSKHVVLDLSVLESINRVGVKCILDTLALGFRHNVEIVIVTPSAEVLRVMKLNGFTDNAQLYKSRDIACRDIALPARREKQVTENIESILICQNKIPIGWHLRSKLQTLSMKPRYHIVIERDLKEAYQRLRKEEFHCLILDSSLSMIKFESFIDNVHDDIDIHCVPMLVVTTEETMHSAELMICNGVHDMIRFPFEAGEIFARLQLLMSYVKAPVIPDDPSDKTQKNQYRPRA